MDEYFCPICKKPSRPGDESFPFCSRRCKLVDLGSWLEEKYRIVRPVRPGETPAQGEAPPHPVGGGHDEEE
jgi:uncharacterized protein